MRVFFSLSCFEERLERFSLFSSIKTKEKTQRKREREAEREKQTRIHFETHQANRLLHCVAELVEVVDLLLPPLAVGHERLELRVPRVRSERRSELVRREGRRGGEAGERGGACPFQQRRRRRRRRRRAMAAAGGKSPSLGGLVVRRAHGAHELGGALDGGRRGVAGHFCWGRK